MSPVFYEITGVIVTLLVAMVSYYFLEPPFLKLGRRYNNNANPQLSTVFGYTGPQPPAPTWQVSNLIRTGRILIQ